MYSLKARRNVGEWCESIVKGVVKDCYSVVFMNVPEWNKVVYVTVKSYLYLDLNFKFQILASAFCKFKVQQIGFVFKNASNRF